MTDEKNQKNEDKPQQPDRNDPTKGEKRPERGTNIFWFILLTAVAIAAVWSFVGRDPSREKITYTQLYYGLTQDDAARKYDKTNVFELVIGPDYITFQDKPAKKPGSDVANDEKIEYFKIPAVALEAETKKELTDALKAKGIEFTFDTPTPPWQQFLYLLIIPILFIVFILFLFRRMGNSGGALSFGRSRGKLYAQEELGITFKDVAGIEEAVHELREVVDFLKSPEKYQALGGRIPKGVLLVGPPGTGKTLLAKAVAGEAGVPFFGLSGSDFVEMFVGVGAARVRDMFSQAVQKSPAIIFIDELDALGKTRGSGMPGGHDEREQTLNALLVEMDGFGSDDSVIVMGATNRPETLDPALLRPGRFDRHVLVDRPDITGREAILKVHCQKIKMDETVDIARVARLTSGFVGADLSNLVNEAALLAARAEKKKVSMEEFEEGIDRVVAGLEKQRGIMHEETKQRVAYHEAGHALVASSLPNVDPVHKISIIPRGFGALGYVMQRPEDDRHLLTQSEIESRIMVALGGIIAEEIIYGETSTGPSNDLERASDLARRMVTEFGMSKKLGRVHYSETQTSPFLTAEPSQRVAAHAEETRREIDEEVKQIIDTCQDQVTEILTTQKPVLEQLTKELLEHETIDSEHLARLLDEHRTGPKLKPGTFVSKPQREAEETSETRPSGDVGESR